MVLEPYVLNAIAARSFGSPAFTATAEMFVKNKAEKCSVEQTKVKSR